jgi:ABC-2 type transport system permease protein
MITRRNLLTIFRTPEAILPPIAISIFFLFIYESTLGGASNFLPGLAATATWAYPASVHRQRVALRGGHRAQNLVRDVSSGTSTSCC